MKNESFYEESESNINNKNTKKIDRVLKFNDNTNANYPNIHKKYFNKNKIRNNSDNETWDFKICWHILASLFLLACVLYFFFFVGFPIKRANILASEYGKID